MRMMTGEETLRVREPLFIAAGTRGSKRVGGREQAFVSIRERTSVEHVVAAALEASSVGPIYVWGDRERLEARLGWAVKRAEARGIGLHVVEEGNHFVENFVMTILRHLHGMRGISLDPGLLVEPLGARHWGLWRELSQEASIAGLRVNLLTSDLPLIRPEEIDCLVSGKRQDAHLVLGRSVRAAIDTAVARCDEPFQYDRAVKNYYSFLSGDEPFELIVNNFLAGQPFRVPRFIWNLAGHLFNNRTIIEGGRFNLKKIKNNVVFVKSLFSKARQDDSEGIGHVRKNYYQMLKAFSFLVRAYFIIVKNKDANRKFRDLAVLEERIRTLTGMTLTLHISDCAGPALDIDTEYEIEYIERHFEKLRNGDSPRSLA
ncbi:MAG: hypothetical protein HQL86_03380 [Magnetococcales bacterium]|nr:hypothetical protein [Magnetococcales bacterium]